MTGRAVHRIPAPLPGCIPRGNIDLDQLETAATATLALYDKLVRSVNCWLDRLDTEGLLRRARDWLPFGFCLRFSKASPSCAPRSASSARQRRVT